MTPLQSTAAAIRAMVRIVATGGEGVMLRKPGSAYWPDGRSVKLLKLVPRALARIGAPNGPPFAPGCDMARFDWLALAL